MLTANENYYKLDKNYLFKRIAGRVEEFKKAHPERDVISLGLGDVSLPLAPHIAAAFSRAAAEMSEKSGFHGYAPYYGYDFLKEAVKRLYLSRGVTLGEDEIFISDGAKCDLANLTGVFGKCRVVIPSPAYPVYSDANVISGNAVTYIPLDDESDFLPLPDYLDGKSALIYLCSPNNPTGAAYPKEVISRWVDYALRSHSLIVFDNAYEAFITEDDKPHSIFETDGAISCAIEVSSLSKRAGFTGIRCGWTVVPKTLKVGFDVNALWGRRQSTKFNGVCYAVQKAAEAALSERGIRESRSQIDYYLKNAAVLSSACKKSGLKFFGGVNSPYLWVKCPSSLTDEETFDLLLNRAGIVCTPGSGFGAGGGGYIRLTAFASRENTLTAAERISAVFK